MLASPVAADTDDSPKARAWEALRKGRAVLLLRHATAPGIGDPPSFVLNDCSTQRNLSDRGRAEARRWGSFLKDKGITQPLVLSSRWCRSLDTAWEMGVASVEPLELLDSFFSETDRQGIQTARLRLYLNKLPSSQPVILVSHQVNITALTGVFPRSSEGLILALPITDPVTVLAAISPP